MSATEKTAWFIVTTGYKDIPRDAVEKAKRTALDCLGAALAGAAEPGSQAITARSRLRPDDMERSTTLVLELERVADIGTLMAILRSPSSREVLD
jgi:2-methylcitrate dehydratase PrpD